MNLPSNDMSGRVPLIKDYPKKYERTFKAYFEGRKIQDCDFDDIFDLVKMLVDKVGLTRKNAPTEGQVTEVVKGIVNNLGNFTTQEIELAFDLQAFGDLICEVKHFQTFSAEYVGQVMKCYKKYFRSKIAEAEIKAHRKREEAKNQIEMKKKTMPECWAYVRGFYNSKRVLPAAPIGYYTELYKWCEAQAIITIDPEVKKMKWQNLRERITQEASQKNKRLDPFKHDLATKMLNNPASMKEHYARELFYYQFKNETK